MVCCHQMVPTGSSSNNPPVKHYTKFLRGWNWLTHPSETNWSLPSVVWMKSGQTLRLHKLKVVNIVLKLASDIFGNRFKWTVWVKKEDILPKPHNFSVWRAGIGCGLFVAWLLSILWLHVNFSYDWCGRLWSFPSSGQAPPLPASPGAIHCEASVLNL